jgi:protein phosphatase 2C family protein 2/3
MGAELAKPVTEKHSTEGHDDRLVFGASCMQGWRAQMQDEHVTILNLSGKGDGYAYFAVYDGCQDRKASEYLRDHLHEKIVNDRSFEEDIPAAIKRGFLDSDDDLRTNVKELHEYGGSTAATLIMTPQNRIYVGNTGDSRVVISMAGVAKPMSRDHKMELQEEWARVEKAGGFGDLRGGLSLSRAFGLFKYKAKEHLKPEEQLVTALPDVSDQEINDETEFAVLACDGIWDCATSQQVVTSIRDEISKGNDLKATCENLMDHYVATDRYKGTGHDNMSIIVVGFLHGKSVQGWYEQIRERVAKGTVVTQGVSI